MFTVNMRMLPCVHLLPYRESYRETVAAKRKISASSNTRVTEEDKEDMAEKLLKYSVTLEQYEAAYKLADVSVYVYSKYAYASMCTFITL